MSRGSDLDDHVTAVKPNGGHVSYSDTSATTQINGKTSSEEFEHIIHSMAQVWAAVKPKRSLCCLYSAFECNAILTHAQKSTPEIGLSKLILNIQRQSKTRTADCRPHTAFFSLEALQIDFQRLPVALML